MGVLTNSPAVMIWRRVSNLETAEAFSNRTMSWPRVGTNQYAVVSDTGNVLLGQWVQALCPPGGGCSKLDLNKFDLVSNPGSELVVASRSIGPAVASIRAATRLPARPLNGKASFVDEDGNFTGMIRTKGTLKGQSARKLASLLKTGVAGGPKARPLTNPVVGYTLLVTDLKASTQFYKSVLGLRPLDTAADSVSFDVGTMILTLKPEPALGLVRSLRRTKRLEGDWVVFHVRNIEADVKTLKAKGVKFPEGIEESVHGLGAYFTDPDGYSYGLWIPPNRPDAIDYFPELQRILRSAAWMGAAR